VSSHESEFSESIEFLARTQWSNSPVASILTTIESGDQGNSPATTNRLMHVHKALLPDDWANYADVVDSSGHQCIEIPLDVLTGGVEALWAVLLFR
jgi:hypothetical protein